MKADINVCQSPISLSVKLGTISFVLIACIQFDKQAHKSGLER